MATIPAAGHISNAARTQSEVQSDLEDIVASLRQVPGAAQAEVYVVIASGTATLPGSSGIALIDTEGLSATDDLANLATTNYPDGSCIVIRNAQLGRVVTVKHLAGGAGQINLDRSVDYVMDDEQKYVLLQRRGTDWYEIFRGPVRWTSFTVAKTANYTVAREDLGKVLACSGTFTVTLTAAASLGNGFVIGIKNTGSGIVTIDPNGSELIDGVTTLVVNPGWAYMVVCDGVAWRTISTAGARPTLSPIINGTMEIWQRGTAFAAVANGQYTADRWVWGFAGAGVVTINRSSASVPTVAQAGIVLNYSLEIDVTTPDAAIAAGDIYFIGQKIEGGLWRHFAQRTLTVSFWVLSSKTGTHCISLRNSIADRSYVVEYTIAAANTCEYKSVTFEASPSAGTWDYTNGTGGFVAWALAGGSTFQTTAGAWQTGNFLATSGQVNVMDNGANFFRLTGVKMELGTATSPLGVAGFDDELLRCLRYYQKSFLYATAPAQNAGSNTGEQIFPQTVAASTSFNTVTVPLLPMRGVPTITFYNPNAANAQVRNRNTNTDCTLTTAYNNTEKLFTIQATTPGGSATAQTLAVHWGAEAEL